ncbi:MAG: CHRD domain-containing protein [Chloroflexi bacterium]|nr:CHRD domain-containing protein [Chloroflexota bacterium]
MSGMFRFPNSLKVPRPSLGLFLILMGLLVPLLIAACGGDDPTAVPRQAAATQPAPTAMPQATSAPDPTAMPAPTAMPVPAAVPQATSVPAPTAAPPPASTPAPVEPPDVTVEVSSQGPLGLHLVSDGMTLYLFTKDERNVSACAGPCADKWPPLLTSAAPMAGEGVDADRLTTIERSDGSSQVVYNGRPLYHFADDQNPGDTLGQDFVDKWFVVTADGGAVFTSAPVNASESAELGTILTDAAGRSLYLFANDTPNVSNCAGGCALFWPPLITVQSPAPGDAVTAAHIGTTTRADGSKQVTYDGSPLYFFANDEKPGDTLGQGIGNLWFVINNFKITIALNELNGSGQSGSVTLSSTGQQTELALSATSGISDLAHIHNGSCQSLGGVVHGLSGTLSSSSSTTVDATLDSLIAGSYAVNLHANGNPGLYTSCGDIAVDGQSLTIALGELNGSGQSGWATLTGLGAQTQVVVLATEGISALAHIHNGGCDTLGGVVHGLSDTSGGTSSTVVDATLDALTVGSFAVNLHTDGNAGVYTSCGTVSVEGQSLTIALGELNGSGQSGWATLTAMGDQTQVEISATAGISALAHIHDGPCSVLGGVVYGLSDTSGAASSSVVDATLDSLIAGSFAVNLHTDGDPGLYSSCGDI